MTEFWQTATAPHPAPESRVRGPVSNHESFRAASQCRPGTPMARTGTERGQKEASGVRISVWRAPLASA